MDEIDTGMLLKFEEKRLSALQPFGFVSHVHPMGAVEKLDGTTRVGWRIVHDYSFPKGGAVNDRINYVRLQYDKMDAALAYVARHPGCYMAKIDVTAFFRHLPTDPSDWPLLCALWDFGDGPELLVDTRMPFGLKHTPEVCCRFSAVVLGMLHKALVALGYRPGLHVHISNVVDDWLVLSNDERTCEFVWLLLSDLLRDLGFSLSEKKLQGPCHKIKWLGLLIDSVQQRVFLPPSKIAKATRLLASFAERRSKKATRREVDRLIGILSYCSSVVYGGRAFLHSMQRRRYRDAAGHVRAVNDHIYLNSAFLLDVAWWRRSIEHFNGFVSIVDADATCDIRIDATGLGGVGVFCDGGFVALSGAQLRQHYLGIRHPDTSSSTE